MYIYTSDPNPDPNPSAKNIQATFWDLCEQNLKIAMIIPIFTFVCAQSKCLTWSDYDYDNLYESCFIY